MKPVYDGDIHKVARLWRRGDPPRVVVWEITLACDLGCRHCGSRAGAPRPDELSTEEALDLVGQLARLGVREVTLIGGEAYLREDWVDIAAAVTAAGMVCTMVTGGKGLDAWRLAEARAAGVRQIGVSIDGIGLTHDRLRGAPGSFEAAVDCARRIAAIPTMGLGVNTQINRLSMPELPQLADLLKALGANAWQLQLTVPLGRAADRPDMLLQPYDLLRLFPLLHQLKTERLAGSGVQMIPGNNIGYYGRYERALRIGGHQGHTWQGCGAGSASLGIEADGRIKGCPSLPTEPYAAGNVREADVETIWRERSEIRALGQRTEADLWGFCRTCPHASVCLAGCTWTAHALFGRPGNNPYCHFRAETLDRQGRRERVELVEAAPGRPFDHGRFHLVEEDRPDGEGEADALAAELARALAAETPVEGFWSREGLDRLMAKRRPRPRPGTA